MEIWELQPPGTLWATLGHLYLYVFNHIRCVICQCVVLLHLSLWPLGPDPQYF